MRTLVVSDEDDVIVRDCACGCNPPVRFAVRPKSRRIYFSKKHQKHAKNLRRKLRPVAPLRG
jgi:hypothetical protein